MGAYDALRVFFPIAAILVIQSQIRVHVLLDYASHRSFGGVDDDSADAIPDFPVANNNAKPVSASKHIVVDENESGGLPDYNNNFLERLPSWMQGTSPTIPLQLFGFLSNKLLTLVLCVFTFPEDYFSWHASEKSKLDATNWRDSKYLILVCRKHHRCGGLSDRLKPLPLLVLTAYKTKRLFLIYWDKPAQLQEFLMPNDLDWSVPDYISEHLNSRKKIEGIKLVSEKTGYRKLKGLREGNVQAPIVNIVLQDRMGGLQEYENITAVMHNTSGSENTDTYKHIYHQLFRSIFRPSPPVQQLIDEQMDKTGLKPGEYAIAHLRANYGIEVKVDKQSPREAVRKQAINAVKCASVLRPGGPIYFASDSKIAIEEALKYGKEINRKVSSYDGPEPLHIDVQWKGHTPDEFYSVFVDLYMMGNGRCTAYGRGGFGMYASLMGYNSTCEWVYLKKGMKECNWTD